MESSIFKERIGAAMKAKGYNNAALAREARFSAAAIGNYGKGRMPRGCDEIVKLANALDVTPDYLLGFSDEPQSHRRGFDRFDNYEDVYRTLYGLLLAFYNHAELSLIKNDSTVDPYEGNGTPLELRLVIRDEKLLEYFDMDARIEHAIEKMPEISNTAKANFYERMRNDKLTVPELPF